jgi:carboxypeptidase C (cathepsin A)
MRHHARRGVVLIALAILGGTGFSQTAPAPATGRGGGAPAPAAPPAAAARPEERTDNVVTRGTLKPSGKAEMAYTAVAGYMPLKDETGKLRANIFSVAYVATPPGAATEAAVGTAPAETPKTAPLGNTARPITFLFNGGPGAASAWLHLAVGPKRLDMPADGSAPKPPYRVIDNEYCWLPATDMVFVDPVNTGYSRAATPEQAREFFGVREDIHAMGEFIRLWLTKNQRWGSPVYLAGESYGTTRAAGLSNYLQERVGASVSGITLISTVLNFATLSPGEANDLPYTLCVPSYAAVAWYHKKVQSPGGLDALLKDAEAFAVGDYTTALAKGASLSPEDRRKTAKRLADLTGLSEDYVLAANLRIAPARFEKELLRAKGDAASPIIGRFDGRVTGFPTDNLNDGQEYDPSLAGFYAAYTSAFNVYVRQTLKYDNDLAYEILSNRTQPWDYSSGGAGGAGGFLYVGDDLRDAMVHNPSLRVLVCSGRFDLATPYFATDYSLSHLTLAPEIRKNITTSYYPAGHMLYHVREGLQRLYGDATAFIKPAN